MATANARGGRRRWMLHEEVRAGSAASDAEALDTDATDGGRRYLFDNNSASFAVASKLLPQRLISLWALLATGLGAVAGLAAADRRPASIRNSLGIENLSAIEWTTAPSSLGAWFSNLSLIVASLLCLLVYGLRRHRLDDYRGKYRRWLAASIACGAASMLLSTGLHRTFAEVLTTRTGLAALPHGAIWWLVPTALVGGWIMIRVAFDMRPCRMGLFALATACALYIGALAANFALLPGRSPEFVSEPMARCAGHVLLVIALLAQVRFIVLEASGEITVARTSAFGDTESQEKPVAERKPSPSPAPTSWTQQPVVPPVVPIAAVEARKATGTRPSAKKSLIAAAKAETKWVDGRDSRDADDDEDERPLSKADRKRLRKEQLRNRAA